MAYYKKALYSRIYNKIKFDPVEKFAFVVTLCIATLFSFFSCVCCYAIESESVQPIIANGIAIQNANYFVAVDNRYTAYFEYEKGYIYHITNVGNSNINIVISNQLPAVNVPFNVIERGFPPNSTYSYIGNGGEYVYICMNSDSTGGNISITREKIPGQESAVDDLVNNVGVNQMWSVFEDGISFVGVVVLVAFGLFLVVLAIKKVSKGKSEF